MDCEVKYTRADLAASAPDASQVTQTLARQLIERDANGRAKYGKTLDRPDLTRNEWLQHLIEELLDAAGYAEAAKHSTAAEEGHE